jgi:hypothetical protein
MYLKKILPSLFMFYMATVLSAAEPETKAQTSPPEKSAAVASDSSAAAPQAVPDEPVIPKRELKFDVTEEEVPLPLEQVRERILDQRYVAVFRLVFTKKSNISEENNTYDTRGRNGEIIRLGNVIGLSNPNFFRTLQRMGMVMGGGRSGVGGVTGESLGNMRGRANPNFAMAVVLRNYVDYNYFNKLCERQNQLLIGNQQSYPTFYPLVKGFFLSKLNSEKDQIEEHRLPTLLDRKKAIVSPFEKKDVLFADNNISSDKNNDPAYVQIRLLFTSSEEAEKCVEAWFSIYDWAVCYPAQKECLNIRKKLNQMLAENMVELNKKEAELGNVEKEADKYKEFEDITHEALVTLKTQRRMLAVDLAGVKARIDACQQMLAKERSAARMDQIETTRVNAEIELRGLNAKQAEIDCIIQGAQNRQKILSIRQQFPGAIERLKMVERDGLLAIKQIEDFQLGFQPLPVEDNKVTIRRIKWISPPKSE